MSVSTLQNTDQCRKDNMNNKRNIVIFKTLLCLFAPVICVAVIPELFFLIGRIFNIDSPYYLIFILILVAVSLIITGIHYIIGAKMNTNIFISLQNCRNQTVLILTQTEKSGQAKKKQQLQALGHFILLPHLVHLCYCT